MSQPVLRFLSRRRGGKKNPKQNVSVVCVVNFYAHKRKDCFGFLLSTLLFTEEVPNAGFSVTFVSHLH